LGQELEQGLVFELLKEVRLEQQVGFLFDIYLELIQLFEL
jgi:hypothetical protein